MRFAASCEITLHPGIADPEGSTIEGALPALGFEGVSGVRVGKLIRFDIDAVDEAQAQAQAEAMCERFLANPVIEAYSVRLTQRSGVG